MKNFICLSILFSFVSLFAQQGTLTPKKTQNIYLNASANLRYRGFVNNYGLHLPNKYAAISLLIRPKPNKIVEMGFSQLYLHRHASATSQTNSLNVSLDFSYLWILGMNQKFPIKPILGAEIHPYLSNEKNTAKTNLTYSTRFQFWGADVGMNTGLLYEYKSKWIFWVSNSTYLMDFDICNNKTSNENLPKKLQRNIDHDGDFSLGGMVLKVGIAAKIR